MRPLLSLVLEVAAAGIMLYTSLNPDINLIAVFWLVVWKVSRGIAHGAGTLGMKAELRYFDAVKA